MPARLGVAFLGKGAAIPCETGLDSHRHRGSERYRPICVAHYGWEWRERDNPDQIGRTEWAPFKADTEYMNPSDKPFMMNFRVDDLEALLEQLQDAGIELIGEPEDTEYGKFAWVMDPNGIKIELWQPPDAEPPAGDA